MQDPDCDGLMEKYKNADGPDTRCLRQGLRRKPGLHQLGDSGESEEAFALQKVDSLAPSTPISLHLSPTPAGNVTVRSLLAELTKHKPDWKVEQQRLKAKRATWEASTPTNFDSHANHVTPGHTLEYINQGVPTPKKKKEDFNVSTKGKRRNSSQ